MSSAARWTLRLPRRHITFSTAPARNSFRAPQQKRWLQQPSRSLRRAKGVLARSSKSQRERQIRSTAARPQGQPQQQKGNEEQRQPEQQQPPQEQVGRNTQLATALAESDTSDLVADVHIPDDAGGVLPRNHPALAILGNSSLVIQRQIEMMNVMLGFEQANRYIIMDGQGQTLGYIAEQDHGIGRTLARQLARTHRSFTTHIFDAQEREVLRIHRPFAYINSRIRIYDPVPEGGYTDTATSTALQGVSASSAISQNSVAQTSPLKLDDMRIIGEAQQQWAPLRRKYNLFTYRALEPAPSDTSTPRLESGDKPDTSTTALTEHTAPDREIEAGMSQFASINEPFLSWDFTLRDADSQTVGSVNRNFVGFAREIFTDTGVYALRMDSAAQSSSLESAQGEELAKYERDATAMTLDQRAVMLATAVSIDFDYFSRHSHAGGGGFMPLWFPGMGGGAAEGGAAGGAAGAGAGAAGEAGAVGAAEGAGAVGGAAGRGVAGAGAGAAESGMAGAGTMAGYEAMQRGAYGQQGGAPPDDMSPQAPDAGGPVNQFGETPFGQDPSQNQPGNDDVWGEGQDPWGGQGSSGDGGGGGGGEGGGGWLDTLSDFFGD
ncbi:uncharacterized protein LTR77_009861 [Saxophila tyrrhenica]|uniref:Scramblase-domain-containing protein n=1 Tax=Saxophila tyrrhenica TaxID=1690608 RepID=A0AAV9P1B9_9PEZI|nr:hypothetical protein LTR77_009861 [Saxophila tyrrhenica]